MYRFPLWGSRHQRPIFLFSSYSLLLSWKVVDDCQYILFNIFLSWAQSTRNPYQVLHPYFSLSHWLQALETHIRESHFIKSVFINSTLSFGREGLIWLDKWQYTSGGGGPTPNVKCHFFPFFFGVPSYLQLKSLWTLGYAIQIRNLNIRIRIQSWVLGFEPECWDLECTKCESN